MSSFITTNLKYLRKRKQLSQQELANQLNLSRSNIAAYERGNSEPNVSKLLRMADFFDVNLSDFLGQDLTQDTIDTNRNVQKTNNIQKEHLEALQEKVDEVDNMLNSIRKFHKFRLPSYSNQSSELKSLMINFDNLINLCEYLIEENRHFLGSIQSSEWTQSK